jgi:60S ribosome biogenesis protein Rrp14/Surfeit locus protein 6
MGRKRAEEPMAAAPEAPPSRRRKRSLSFDQEGAAAEQTLRHITAHDEYFCSMLDMLPASLVIPMTSDEKEEAYASKFMKNKKGAAPQQAKKEKSRLNKKARYDAANAASTTLQKQQQKAAKEKAEAAGLDAEADSDADGSDDGIAGALNGHAANGTSAADADSMSEDDDDDDDDDEEADESLLHDDAVASKVNLRETKLSVASAAALREKVQARIAALKTSRAAKEGGRRDKKNAHKKDSDLRGRRGAKGRKGKGSEEVAKAKAAAAQAKPKAAAAAAAPLVVASLPALPTVQDVGDIEFSGLKMGGGESRGVVPGKSGSKMRKLTGLLKAAEIKQNRLQELRRTEEVSAHSSLHVIVAAVYSELRLQ